MKCTACKKRLRDGMSWSLYDDDLLCSPCWLAAKFQARMDQTLAVYGIDPHQELVPPPAKQEQGKPKPVVEHIVVRGEDIWPSWFPIKDNRPRKR